MHDMWNVNHVYARKRMQAESDMHDLFNMNYVYAETDQVLECK